MFQWIIFWAEPITPKQQHDHKQVISLARGHVFYANLKSSCLHRRTSNSCPYTMTQKNAHPDSSSPGITTIRKNAQLTRVKVFTKAFPRPGYSRT